MLTNAVCLQPNYFFPEASFYPGLNGIDSILNVENDNLADTIPDEAHFEREDDWIQAPSTAEVSQAANDQP
jgi:hypothetical protein